jgi:hypothetical protein
MKNNVISFKYLLIFAIAFCISILGATYAYFAFSVNNNTSIGGSASMVTMSLQVKKVFPKNQVVGLVPQLSGTALNSALKYGCIDTSGNTVCQVYNIHVKNSGNSTISVDGRLSFFSDEELKIDSSLSIPNLKWMLVSSVDEVDSNNSVLGNGLVYNANASGSVFADNVSLGINIERDYYVIVWINEVNDIQEDQGKNFYGKVDFVSSNGNGVTATFVE